MEKECIKIMDSECTLVEQSNVKRKFVLYIYWSAVQEKTFRVQSGVQDPFEALYEEPEVVESTHIMHRYSLCSPPGLGSVAHLPKRKMPKFIKPKQNKIWRKTVGVPQIFDFTVGKMKQGNIHT